MELLHELLDNEYILRRGAYDIESMTSAELEFAVTVPYRLTSSSPTPQNQVSLSYHLPSGMPSRAYFVDVLGMVCLLPGGRFLLTQTSGHYEYTTNILRLWDLRSNPNHAPKLHSHFIYTARRPQPGQAGWTKLLNVAPIYTSGHGTENIAFALFEFATYVAFDFFV